MKVYVVYQLGYNGSELMEILGVFKNLEKAKETYRFLIKDNIKNYDFIEDNECKYTEELINGQCMTRLFGGGYQENWDNYLEFHIEEQEII